MEDLVGFNIKFVRHLWETVRRNDFGSGGGGVAKGLYHRIGFNLSTIEDCLSFKID